MIRRGKSVIVVADTHFGLRNEMFFEPEVFSSFLRWVKILEKDEAKPLNLGDWEVEKNVKKLNPPDKIILLGDILELWDASDKTIDAYIRSFTNLFSQLDCEKIYVLGNHDDILEEIASKQNHYYPLGSSGVRIIKDIYPDQSVSEEGVETVKTLNFGDQKYLFIHGQQFDKYFADIGRLYMIIPYMREAAMAFGNFTWLFVFLFFIGFTLMFFRWYAPSLWMLILLGLLAVPRVFISIARPFFSAFKSIRYHRLNPILFNKWWRKFSRDRKYIPKNLNIVYGHTHIIDIKRDLTDVTFLNVPSWVKDTGSGNKRKNVLRAVFLYIDEDGSTFIGWDWNKLTPFFIPNKIITKRRNNEVLTEKDKKRLEVIGWPRELLDKWIKPLPKLLERSKWEAIKQELKR